MQADFLDLKKLHILTDKLLRLAHILRLNIRLGYHLTSGVSDLRAAASPALSTSFDEMQARLGRYVYGQETSLARIETLIARSAGIGQLVSADSHSGYDIAEYISPQVQGIQDSRANEAGKQINREMQRLTEESIKETGMMKRLTEQSTKDTRSMMTIALISAIFLPATFLAVSKF